MKTAFPIWENRIEPVFNVARQVFIVEMEFGHIVHESEKPLTGDLPIQKALRPAELGGGHIDLWSYFQTSAGDDRRLRHSGHSLCDRPVA